MTNRTWEYYQGKMKIWDQAGADEEIECVECSGELVWDSQNMTDRFTLVNDGSRF